jgi:multiple sugar transport system permease protein
VLVRVIVPTAAPGLVSTGLLAFLMAWDEFLYALILTQSNASKALPIALNDFIGRHGIDFGLLAAGGVIAAIPPVLIAFVFQRYIVAGLTAGSVKG